MYNNLHDNLNDIMYIRCLIIGDSGVGKSSIALKYTENKYNNNIINTIGVEFYSKTIKKNNNLIKFQIWDTAGQERYRTLSVSYYRGTDVVILCYDITKKETFYNLDKWIKEIKTHAREDIYIILCGCKNDLDNRRLISYNQAETYANINGFKYFELSAKSGNNINELFEHIMEKNINIPKKINTLEIKNNNYYNNKCC